MEIWADFTGRLEQYFVKKTRFWMCSGEAVRGRHQDSIRTASEQH